MIVLFVTIFCFFVFSGQVLADKEPQCGLDQFYKNLDGSKVTELKNQKSEKESLLKAVIDEINKKPSHAEESARFKELSEEIQKINQQIVDETNRVFNECDVTGNPEDLEKIKQLKEQSQSTPEPSPTATPTPKPVKKKIVKPSPSPEITPSPSATDEGKILPAMTEAPSFTPEPTEIPVATVTKNPGFIDNLLSGISNLFSRIFSFKR